MASLGSSLKKREMLSARLADVLSPLATDAAFATASVSQNVTPTFAPSAAP